MSLVFSVGLRKNRYNNVDCKSRPGSTHIVTPESFMNDLKALGRAGVGGNPPNGRPLSPYVRPPQPPRQISFQE